MPIEFRCSKCSRLLRTPDDTAGKQAKCPECGEVMTIPAGSVPPQPPAPATSGSGSPFGSGSAGQSPFGSDSAAASSADENPYRSPVDFASERAWQHSAGLAGAAIRPTQIFIGDILNRTWTIFKSQWAMCMAGTLFAGFVMFVGYLILFYVPMGIGVLLGNQALIIVMVFVGYLVAAMFMLWMSIGMLRFLLGIARGREPNIGEVFRGGDALAPTFGAWLIVWMASTGVIVITLAVGTLLRGILMRAAGPAFAFSVFFVVIATGYAISMVVWLIFSQSFFLIIDGRAGVIDSLKLSKQLTDGNKLSLFALWLIASGLMFVSMLPLGLGLFVTFPFFMLMLPVVYLSITGQPTAEQMQLRYQPQPV